MSLFFSLALPALALNFPLASALSKTGMLSDQLSGGTGVTSLQEGPISPLYIFMHIPVTGGRSIGDGLTASGLAVKNIFQSPRFAQTEQTELDAKTWINAQMKGKAYTLTSKDIEDLRHLCHSMGTPELGRVDVLAQHISLREIEEIFPSGLNCSRPQRWFTFLREPFQHSHSFLTHQTFPTELFKFKNGEVSDDVRRNIDERLIYQLGDDVDLARRSPDKGMVLERSKETLSKAFFVGFTDNMQTDFNAFLNMLGRPPLALTDTSTFNLYKIIPGVTYLNSAQNATLRSLVDYDTKLYNWAKDKFGA